VIDGASLVLGLVGGGVTAALLLARRGADRAAPDPAAPLEQALQAAARRNDELERLSQLATVLLTGEATADLQRGVARAAAELLAADASTVMLLTEGGRYLQLVAAFGLYADKVGGLIPVDHSLAGWVVTHDEAVLIDDPVTDTRNYILDDVDRNAGCLAIVPLRSAGVVIGAVGVYAMAKGRTFSPHDTQMLQALGDLVVIGLDRAAMLEETRRNEQVLAQKNRDLIRADQLKSQFVTNMSHELRTPLNAIIGFSDLILSGGIGEVNDMQRDFLESVLRNGRHLLGLINNILDLSKIEAGRMQLSLSAVDVREVITSAVTDTASLRSSKEQSCTVEIPPGDPLLVSGDGVRVRQIIYNLLANASKFTGEHGSITLAAVTARVPLPVPTDRANDDTAAARLVPRDAVWVAVRDSGVGIHEADRHKLFTEFGQVDSSLNRTQQGTGLGLALCKSFVEMHGGVIGVDSVVDVGSTFWFILPVDGPVRRTGVTGA
jgi:signal transduction histidine kinase